MKHQISPQIATTPSISKIEHIHHRNGRVTSVPHRIIGIQFT